MRGREREEGRGTEGRGNKIWKAVRHDNERLRNGMKRHWVVVEVRER